MPVGVIGVGCSQEAGSGLGLEGIERIEDFNSGNLSFPLWPAYAAVDYLASALFRARILLYLLEKFQE